MATRCNVLVSKTEQWSDVNGQPNPNNGKHWAQYYRHWDGYPSGAGLDLALKLIHVTNTNAPADLSDVRSMESALRSVLTLDYEREGSYAAQKSLHGDIEWLYHIDLDNGLTLTAYELGIGRFDSDEWEKAPAHQLLRLRTVDYRGKQVWQFISLTVKA